ncbi:3'-5' exonuclease [Pararcticibacter amylolyticus]|uniref:Exonuclease n=1 Tax=Pararcticibacter amylolyticus TaxID=2173175 RepID=A0A2U2PNC1_9SPHI|nr:3'-5' exonuclease [Pararcticibacter amylolyticus]PWG82689.1 exonuclease [Pararcticibacter amylolyticus]
MPDTFTAIDFETAQGKRWSICQIGLIRVEKGVPTQKFDVLIKPPGNEYSFYNTQVHGITAEMTAHAPAFNHIWQSMLPFIEGQKIVAHNAAFDCSCLEQTLAYYKLKVPDYTKVCTYQIYKRKLAELCSMYKISLSHHNALSDAQACAQLYLRYLRNGNNTVISR